MRYLHCNSKNNKVTITSQQPSQPIRCWVCGSMENTNGISNWDLNQDQNSDISYKRQTKRRLSSKRGKPL